MAVVARRSLMQTLKLCPARYLGSQQSPWLWQGRSLHNGDEGCNEQMSLEETKRIVRHLNMQALKKELQARQHPCIEYSELTDMCRDMGLANSIDDAKHLVRAMDDAGDVILFRNTVFLDPERIAELIAGVLPVHLVSEDDPRMKEFEELRKCKEEIEEIAYKQVRKCLWFGLIALTGGTGLFVRLTFWELSWDVMEPIAFFMTTSFLIAGYAYFLFSRRDPTYQGLMHSMLLSRRKKIMKRRKFDFQRYRQLERICSSSTCRSSLLSKITEKSTAEDDD